MVYPASTLKDILGSVIALAEPSAQISILLTDSRQLSNPKESLFFALNAKRNGQDFIPVLYKAGVRNFVIGSKPEAEFPEANFYLVADVLSTLQNLAAYHRNRFGYNVIGITGSNGKTIVKEWLYQLISPDKKIIRNPKSYNSQIGVPLAVWGMDAEHELGIFEAGISQPGEMEKLEKVIRPVTGILTHIGPAHNEGFKIEGEKVKEKLKLFKGVETFIYHQQDLAGYGGLVPGKKPFSIGTGNADLTIIDQNIHSHQTKIEAVFKGKNVSLSVPYTDEASLKNIMSCWAMMLIMGYEQETISRRMEKLLPVSMRLQLKTGIRNCSVIDDSYNADVQSLEIALQFLDRQNQHKNKVLILSDIFQSGMRPADLYGRVAQLIQQKKVHRFVGVGLEISRQKEQFPVSARFFDDTEALLSHLPELNFHDAGILIKGSRSFAFERISRALEQKAHETVMEINMNALQHNLGFYRSKLKPGVKIMAMVKAFSYGSGSFEIANLLQFNRVDYLAVAYADEGIALRQAGISMPVLVLNPGDGNYEKLVEYKLEPELYSFRLLESFIRYAESEGLQHYPVHLKMDTGMKRLGFETGDMDDLTKILTQNTSVKIASVFSHLAASSDPAYDDFSFQQMEKFHKMAEKIELILGYKFLRHIANTSAIHRFPDAQMDMVRAGIGLYGIDAAFSQNESPLQTVATLKTSISQIKQVKAGETVGYNRMGKLEKDGQIATVKIGYADGYTRAFGNGAGFMMINGKPAPTVGNISMDMTMVDITGIDVQEGDEVLVFGAELPIKILSGKIGTIPYELLTGVSQRVKRVYFFE